MTDPLTQALDALLSNDILTAHQAVETLESHPDTFRYTAELLTALPHCRPLIQLRLVALIEKSGDCRAVHPLMDILRQTEFTTLRYTLIQALGTLGDPTASSLIASFAKDPDSYVRTHVQTALYKLSQKV